MCPGVTLNTQMLLLLAHRVAFIEQMYEAVSYPTSAPDMTLKILEFSSWVRPLCGG